MESHAQVKHGNDYTQKGDSDFEGPNKAINVGFYRISLELDSYVSVRHKEMWSSGQKIPQRSHIIIVFWIYVETNNYLIPIERITYT